MLGSVELPGQAFVLHRVVRSPLFVAGVTPEPDQSRDRLAPPLHPSRLRPPRGPGRSIGSVRPSRAVAHLGAEHGPRVHSFCVFKSRTRSPPGSYSGRFRIPELHGHLLKAALDRLTAPRRRLSRDHAGDLVTDESALGHDWAHPTPAQQAPAPRLCPDSRHVCHRRLPPTLRLVRDPSSPALLEQARPHRPRQQPPPLRPSPPPRPRHPLPPPPPTLRRLDPPSTHMRAARCGGVLSPELSARTRAVR